MESGTLMALAIATGCAAAIVAGAVLMRRGQTRAGVAHTISSAIGATLLCAVAGAVIVGALANGYLQHAAASCASGGTESLSAICADPDLIGKQSAATGLLGGLVLGVLGGCVMAWWCSRSIWLVAGGLLAAIGSSLLAVESMVVLILWMA